ncbi:DUF996 domain-containing protein [Pseudothermotoga thermarum]|uniref:DUF996 domain-containing protein n=1 Tax=Pseudothermotoga thermarum DSM 5069 TaxID=688269 RepID=F7YUD8_9THEM|nr:DUF996 domain-containing protein [Pseudothermotoga thermarum]AEH51337.1 protein of unknown function DUF996 [Pseudothermotoga thermarum DSM 5069]
MDMKTAKTLAGVGLILTLLGSIPAAGWLLGLIGLILFLVAVNNIAKIVEDQNVFTYFLIPTILWFVALVVISVTLMSSFGLIMMGRFFSAGASTIGGFIAVVVLGIISLVYRVKAYRLLAERLNVPIFNTAASLYKWGAILLIILVGMILMLVGDILAIVGFFTAPDQPKKSENVG